MSDAEFVVLGSGCFAPARPGAGTLRNPAGYALRLGAEVVLFDLGFGNLRQLCRAGLDPDAVGTVFFTHRHPDHVGDLAALLFKWRYEGKPRKGRLRLFGPRGFKAFAARLERAYHPWLRPRGWSLAVEDLGERSVVRGEGWKVSCREVPHTTESLAYRLEAGKLSLAYTGDTGWDQGLARFARGVSLLAVEATLADHQRMEGHLRVSEALELGRSSEAKKVLLTHLSTASEKGLARRLARLPWARAAEDLMRVPLKG
ncbi:MAG: ribonuclease Z [Elusimicrobia bacterium]|nr:ribonuclease Z [Elusimicrobiota bacterium]